MATATESSSVASSSLSSEQQMNIYLKIIKTVFVRVNKSDAIIDLKALLCEKEGISENLQEIFFSGRRLNDEQNLIDCGVQENSTLNLHVENSEVIKLFVSIISKQKTVEIEAKFKDTIENVKFKICLKEDINFSNQFSLFAAGTQLDDSRTIASLGIKENSTLQLFANPRDVLSVSFEFPGGKIVKREVKVLFTVANVKAFIGSIAGFYFGKHYLSYKGKELEDSKTLAHYDLEEDSLLKIVPRKIQILVKTWSGKTVTLCVQENEAVDDVKQALYKKLNLGTTEYYDLMYGGRLLEYNRDLASYGIVKDSTLHMTFKPGFIMRQTNLRDIEYFFSFHEQTTAFDLKRFIKNVWGILVKKLVLESGLELKDSYRLSLYDVDLDTIITVCS